MKTSTIIDKTLYFFVDKSFKLVEDGGFAANMNPSDKTSVDSLIIN